MPFPIIAWIGLAGAGALIYGIKKAMEDDFSGDSGARDHDDVEADNQQRRDQARAERLQREVDTRLEALLQSYRIEADEAQRDALTRALTAGTEPDSDLLDQLADAAPAVRERLEQMKAAAQALNDAEALAGRLDAQGSAGA